MYSFGLAGSLGALAGMAITPITSLSYGVGVMIGLKGFAAAVLGGYGNFVGAIVGGVALGLLESLGAGLISSIYKDVIAFMVLLLGAISSGPAACWGKKKRADCKEITYAFFYGTGRLGRGRGPHAPCCKKSLLSECPQCAGPECPGGHRPQPAHRLRRPDQPGARGLLRPGGLYQRHPHRHLRLVTVWATLVFAAVVVAFLAYLIGMPTLRLTGNYLVMATLGFNLVVNILMVQLDDVTGGPSGFTGVPQLSIFGAPINSDLKFYALIWSLVIVGLLLARNLVVSRAGRGLKALHGSPAAAEAAGVPIEAYKVKVFVLSAVYASVAGSLYAHYYGIVTPKTFDIFYSVEVVTMCIVGGMGSLWGGLLGAAFLTPLPQVLHFFEEYKDIFYGGVLVLILIFLPQGLSGLRLFRRGAPREVNNP